MTICLLSDTRAYKTMRQAHEEGVAIVGAYGEELAEMYCDLLKTKGILAGITPMDKE